MKITKGSIFETSSRKGDLTIKFLVDVDMEKDNFFNAEIVSGKARFLSQTYNEMQKETGLGDIGSVLSFRTSLVKLLKRREDLENK